MKPHGNSLDNFNLHHLYIILKKEDGDTFKYGISDDPIEADGLSERVRKQVFEMNRAEASSIERTFIDDYYYKNERNPIGNLIPKRKL